MASYQVTIGTSTYQVDIPDENPNLPPLPQTGLEPPEPMQVRAITPQAKDASKSFLMPTEEELSNLTRPSIVNVADFLPFAEGMQNRLPVTMPAGVTSAALPYLERVGQKAASKIQGGVERALTENPVAQKFPVASSIVSTPVAMASDVATSMLTPSGAAQTAVLGGAGRTIGKGVHSAVKGASRLIGMNKKAVERAIKNPELVQGAETVVPKTIDDITGGLKQAVTSAKNALSHAYEQVLNKLKGAKKPGKGEFGPVESKIDEVAHAMGLKKTAEGSFVAGKGTSAKITEEEISTLNKIASKLKEDLKGTKTHKLTAEKLHNQRQFLDRHINFETQGDIFNSKLESIRKSIDQEIADKYPEIKDLDKKAQKVFKAVKFVKKNFDIKPGTTPSSDISEAALGKIQRFASSIFKPGGDKMEQITEGRLKDIGAEKMLDKIKDIGASQVFDKSSQSLLSFAGINPASITKALIKTGIKSGSNIGKEIGGSGAIMNLLLRKKKGEEK